MDPSISIDECIVGPTQQSNFSKGWPEQESFVKQIRQTTSNESGCMRTVSCEIEVGLCRNWTKS